MNDICSFFDGSSQCRRDLGETRTCRGIPLKCPCLSRYVRRPEEIKAVKRVLEVLGEEGVGQEQPWLLAKCLAWVLGDGRVPSPIGWFGKDEGLE